MKRKEYVSLESTEPTEYQKKFPDAVPVIGKIIEIDGVLFGEVLRYRENLDDFVDIPPPPDPSLLN